MNKTYKVWTVISPQTYNVLKNIYDRTGSVMTKTILDVIFNKLPEKIEEDYTFKTKDSKTLVITVNQKQKDYIEELAKKEQCKVCRLIRNILYTYFKIEKLI